MKTIKNNYITFVFALLTSCNLFDTRVQKDMLTPELAQNNKIGIMLVDGFDGQEMRFGGTKTILTTSNSTGVAHSFYAECDSVKCLELNIDNNILKFSDFDCRFSTVIIQRKYGILFVRYCIKEPIYD